MDTRKRIQEWFTEFRFPINNYVIASPAGLIDDGEDFTTAALREFIRRNWL